MSETAACFYYSCLNDSLAYWNLFDNTLGAPNATYQIVRIHMNW